MSESRDALLWRVRQVALRSDLRIALAKHESMARSLARCADALCEHLGLQVVAFWWVDASGQAADLIAISRPASEDAPIDPGSRPEPPAGFPVRVPLDNQGIGAIISELTAHVTNELANERDLAPQEVVDGEKLTSFAGYPLLASDQAIGALTLYGRHPMADDALDVMAWVADVISVTLESRRIGEELRDALEVNNREAQRRAVAQQHIALQHRASQILASAKSVSDASPELVHLLAESLGWDVGGLWQLDAPANLRQVAIWHGPDPEVAELAGHLKALAQGSEPGVVSEVVRTRKPVFLKDHDAAARALGGDAPHRGLRSALGIPVASDGTVTSVMTFFCRRSRDVDEELTRTLVTIGSQIAQFSRRKQVEEQLIQAQKMEAVGKLAGGVAHDFNNILTVITGYAAMAMEQVTPGSPVHEQTHEILSASERATSLVNQLLAFSRKQVFHPRTIDLNVVVADMERMLRRLIGEDVRLVTRRPEVPSFVRADLVHLEQIIVNLAVNSRDAMPQGGRLFIEISHLEHEPPPGDSQLPPGVHPFVRVIVRDTGVGMSEEVRSHVFEPFFTTKELGKGSGLGLATVYGIVRQNGGHIRVESEAGKGAQFTIMFPRIIESVRTAPARDVRAAAARGTETILLVEDEKPVRRLAKNILSGAGYDVVEAGSAEEALQVCASSDKPIHLLLTDVVMPGMNGVELSRKLRGSCENVRVLYMSGYAEDSLFDGYAMSRGVAFLEKPFTPTGLAQKVRQVLDTPQPEADPDGSCEASRPCAATGDREGQA